MILHSCSCSPCLHLPVWTVFMVHFRVEILRGPINIWQRHLLWRLAIIKWGYKKFVTRCAAVSTENCLISFSWTGDIILYSMCMIYLFGLVTLTLDNTWCSIILESEVILLHDWWWNCFNEALYHQPGVEIDKIWTEKTLPLFEAH